MFLYVDSLFAETGWAVLQSQMFVSEEDNNLCFHFWFFLKVSCASATETKCFPQLDYPFDHYHTFNITIIIIIIISIFIIIIYRIRIRPESHLLHKQCGVCSLKIQDQNRYMGYNPSVKWTTLQIYMPFKYYCLSKCISSWWSLNHCWSLSHQLPVHRMITEHYYYYFFFSVRFLELMHCLCTCQ